MFAEIMMAAVLASSSTALPAYQETPPQPVSQEPYRLEDLTVEGRPREALIRDFVENVAAPVPGRRLSRWNDPICVGVVNLNRDLSQYLIDRISTVADDLGVKVGEPGCRANVHIIATAEPKAAAAEFFRLRKRDIIPNVTGASNRSLEGQFVGTDSPVRWWYLNEVIVNETGLPAFRRSGDVPLGEPGAETPFISVQASRLVSPYSDSLRQTYIIIDPTRLTNLNSLQLADYLAFISLAQISMTADTTSYDSILNVINEADTVSSLTPWDQAYLEGLYNVTQTSSSVGASREVLRSAINRAATRLAERNVEN